MKQKDFLKIGSYRIDEIKNLAEKNHSHFFDKDTMKFFSSRLSELCWKIEQEIYFITSEADQSYIKHSGSKRAFTVRKCSLNGNIETVGKFQEFSTVKEARKKIMELIQ